MINPLKRFFKSETKEQNPEREKHKIIKLRSQRLFGGDYTLYNSEIVFAAVSRISNALSSMPIQLYKNLAPINNELNDLFKNSPNANMTSCSFFKALEACRCTNGNAYALKIVDEYEHLESIDILDPMNVMPYFNDKGELYYRIQHKNEILDVSSFYVLHVQFISTQGCIGVNPISVLFNTLNYSNNIKSFSTDQLDKGVNAAIVLEAPANLGEVQRKNMIKSFYESYKETRGNVILLESGVTAKTLNLSPIDTKLFEVEKITRSEVAMVYNLPPHLLGDYSDTTFSNIEQQMLEFLTLTMLPIVSMYEQELNRKFLTPKQRQEGYNFKFDMNGLLRADSSTLAEVNYKAIRSAWKTPNEIRAEYGKPPVKNGDELVISRDLIPLDITVGNTELLLGAKNNIQERSDENGK